MSDLKNTFQAIADKWDQVYEQCKANPSACESNLNEIELNDIHDLVGTIGQWIDKISPPKRISGPYRIAKGLIITNLEALDKPITSLVSGDYAQFRPFLINLNQIFSILYSLTINSRDIGEESNAILTAKLSQTIAELERATKELENETENCKAAIKWKDAASNSAEVAAQEAEKVTIALTQAQTNLASIQTTIESANTIATQLAEIQNEATTDGETVSTLAGEADEFRDSIQEHKNNHEKLMQELQETKNRIDELLPEATSAGLAGAFARRVKQLNIPKFGWAIAFVIGIIGFFIISKDITEQLLKLANEDKSIWSNAFQRLPILIPFVWFAWFSARRYGYAERIQEDYANKEASARAFEGYRKQMKDVGTDEETLKFLCENAIEIYSKDPQRIYEHKTNDESPASHLLNKAIGKNKD